MIINVHAGHNNNVPGAKGYINETTEDRKVKDLVISKLRKLNHTVYDTTDNNSLTVNGNLMNIVSKCNQHKVDLDISIHFNAFDGNAHGVEAYTYGSNSKAHTYANNVLKEIASLGFYNRGIKNGSGLYVVKHTNSPAMLIECCFCDNIADYRKYNADQMASAIVKGITGQAIDLAYKVRITVSVLNVRKNNSTSSDIATTVKKNEAYTIIEEKDGWGKLKSGAGWINLAYTERC